MAIAKPQPVCLQAQAVVLLGGACIRANWASALPSHIGSRTRIFVLMRLSKCDTCALPQYDPKTGSEGYFDEAYCFPSTKAGGPLRLPTTAGALADT